MDQDEMVAQLLDTWRRHNAILLYLVDQIPSKGFAAVPAGSRGRDVARQLEHLDRVRRGWLHYHETGTRPGREPEDRDPRRSTRVQLRKALRDSGKQVEMFLRTALAGGATPRLFGKQAVRWMGYLIAHESHHRGSIMLALKQNGMRLPEKVSVRGLWGKWIFGK